MEESDKIRDLETTMASFKTLNDILQGEVGTLKGVIESQYKLLKIYEKKVEEFRLTIRPKSAREEIKYGVLDTLPNENIYF